MKAAIPCRHIWVPNKVTAEGLHWRGEIREECECCNAIRRARLQAYARPPYEPHCIFNK
jgi:hypothetical protein